MSENENENNALQEVTRKVVVTPEDVAGAAEFWPQFEVPMPPELKLSIERFCKDPTLVNQDELKLQLTKAVCTTDHEAFQDEMFKEIVAECRAVSDSLQFDRALEDQLSSSKDE